MTAGPSLFERFREQYDQLWSGRTEESAVMRPTVEQVPSTIGGLRCEIRLTADRQVVEYVPAFVQRTTAGTRELPSVGIALSIGTATVGDDFSFDDDVSLDSSLYERRGPTAVRYRTDVLEFVLPRDALESRVGQIESRAASREEALAGALVSFNAAHALAIFNVIEAELGDFTTSWKVRPASNEVSLYVFDAAEGGNGVAQQAFALWATSGEHNHLIEQIYSLLRSRCCERFCEECILLPRMSERVIRRGLLDKRLGCALIDA